MAELNDEIMDFNKQNPNTDPVLLKQASLETMGFLREESEEVVEEKESHMSMMEELEREAAEAEKKLEELKKKRAEAAAKAAEEQKRNASEPEVSPEEALKADVIETLKKMPGGPTEKDIARWKREYGENGVYVLAISEEEAYVFTYMRRGQWQAIRKVIAAGVESGNIQNGDDALQEKVIQYCVLWPKNMGSTEFLVNSRAGLIQTLYGQIMLQSVFLDQGQASYLTAKL
jgi:hypothetical protein